MAGRNGNPLHPSGMTPRVISQGVPVPRLARAHAPSTRLRLETLEDRDVPAFGLDTSFGTGGLITDALPNVRFSANTETASTPDGKIIVAGSVAGTDPFGPGDLAVARLTSAGTPDLLFGGG